MLTFLVNMSCSFLVNMSSCPLSSACSDCGEGSGSTTLLFSEIILLFYCPFSQFPTIIFLSSFQKLVIAIYLLVSLRCCSIFGALTYKWYVYHRLNGFNITGTAYYNSGDLSQQCKVHSLSTHFFTLLELFHIASIRNW